MTFYIVCDIIKRYAHERPLVQCALRNSRRKNVRNPSACRGNHRRRRTDRDVFEEQ